MDDGHLGELLRARDVRDNGIRDFFDLADRLLDPASIQAVLSRLDRPTLATLWDLADGKPAEVDAALVDLALVTDETPANTYEAVATTLHGWPALGLPGRAELASDSPAALEAVSTVDTEVTDRFAAERAFTTSGAVLEILTGIEHQPARELVRGGLALPDTKRLGAAAGSSLDDLPSLLSLCATAGLIALDEGFWLPTNAASTWRSGSTSERWAQLAGAWFAALPDDIRTLLGARAHARWGEHLAEYVRWLYPASSDRMEERMNAQVRCAELLGITAENAPSTPGSAVLGGDLEAAQAAMAALFPSTVDKAYLQHDLTIVSPGPLAAPLDSRLRELADVESSGLATTYRVSAGSINRAFSAGATAGSIREFLSSISLTGIPQPLEYLIDETARRHGLVRVGTDAHGTYVRSSDLNVLGAIAVDQAVSALGLRRGEAGKLESRFESDIVFWALSDARYPVAAEDRDGTIVSLERRRTASRVATVTDHAAALIAKLRAAQGDAAETGQAWLERQLDVAIKARVAVTVVVTMPNGNQAEYLLEPTGQGGGRLRARDRKADIERTLPLTSIVEVRPAD